MHHVRVKPSPSLTPSCQSNLSVSTLTPLASSERNNHPADLSISSLHTTPLMVDTSCSLDHSPGYGKWTSSQVSSETVQSHLTGRVSTDHGVKFIPHLESVTEIDELWKRFLTSSLLEKESKGRNKCTCGTKKYAAIKKREPTTIELADEKNIMKRCVPEVKKSALLLEKAVQTSPMTQQDIHHNERESPNHQTHNSIPQTAPVSFTVASTNGVRPHTQLTLSEVFALSHPEFIEASLRRQREIRRVQHQDFLQRKCFHTTRKPHSYTPKPGFTDTGKLDRTIVLFTALYRES